MEQFDLHSNVDHDEIQHFAQLAATWWDEQGEFKTLHQINPLRLNYIEQGCDGLFGKNVLDVGCGGGILAESMAKRQAKVLGIDMGQAQIEVAKLHALEQGVKLDYLQTTAEQLALEQPSSFDVITCMEMLEHVPDPSSVIEACSRMLRPGGKLFLSTINRTAQAYFMMILGAERVAKLVPQGTHQYEKFIRPSELLQWCDKAQLHCEHITGVRYLPLVNTLRLDPSVKVNYMLQLRKLN